MPNQHLVSPCIGNCCLNDEDICLGCYRTLDNILNWQASSDEQRLEIIEQSRKRKAKAEAERGQRFSR